MRLTVSRTFLEHPYLFAIREDGTSVFCHRDAFRNSDDFCNAQVGDVFEGSIYQQPKGYAASNIVRA